MNFVKKNWKNIVIIILLLFLIFGGGKSYNIYKRQIGQIDSLTLANQESRKFLNRQNKIVTQQDVLLVESQKSIKKLTDSIFDLKKREQRKIREIKAYYEEMLDIALTDTVYMDYDPDTTSVDEITGCDDCVECIREATFNTIRVPKSVTYTDAPYFHIDMTLKQEGISLNKLSFKDTLSVMVSENKPSIFKPKVLTITSVHSNPYVTTEKQKSIIYKPKPKRQWFTKVLILAAGIFLGSKL